MSQYDQLIRAASAKYGIPVNLLTAQMQAESSGNPNAVSPVGAQGLMQIMPANQQHYGISKPFDPAQSIDAGAHLDADNYKATGNWPDALKMYHGGTNQANWGPKTQSYAQNIMAKTNSLPSFDDMDKAMGGATTHAQNAPKSATGMPSFEDLDSAMQVAPPAPPGLIASIGAGLGHGVGTAVLGAQKLIGQGLNWAGANTAGNWLVNDANTGQANLDQQNQPYADAHSGWNSAANLGGEVAGSAPAIALGGGAATLGLRGAGMALGDNVAGNVLAGASRLIDGTAGAQDSGLPWLIKKGASTAVQGAGANAIGNGLTGGDPLKGAEYGAWMGPAGAAGVKIAGAVASPVVNAVGNAISDLSPGLARAAAANKLSGAIRADGLTPGMIADQMRQMGPQATPVDAASVLLGSKAGGNVRNMAEVVANSPGDGMALAQQVLGGRMDSAPSRINDAAKAATGATGNVHAEADELMAQRSAAAAPLYQKALAGQIQPDARLQSFMADPVFQSGLARGQEIARLQSLAKNEPFNPAEYVSLSSTPGSQVPSSILDASGNPMSVTSVPGKAPMVSMRAADAAKQGLDDLVEQYRDPTTGRLVLDQKGRALNDVRASYVNYLDQVNPDYAAARAAWAGPSSSLDALAMGRKALSNDAEVTSSNVSRLSPSDRQFFLSGVTRALQDKIGSAQDGADITRKIFGNNLIRDRVASAFDNPDAFNQFQNSMQNEAQYAATRNAVLSNSATARRLAGQANQGDIYGPAISLGHNLLTGNLSGAASSAANAANSAVNFMSRPSNRQLSQQANMLFTQDPDAFLSAFAKKGAKKNALTR